MFRISLYNLFPHTSYRALKLAEGNAETPVESVVSEDPLGKVIFFVKLAEERPHRTRRIPPERLPSNHRHTEWEKIILKLHCSVAIILCLVLCLVGKGPGGLPVFLIIDLRFSLLNLE